MHEMWDFKPRFKSYICLETFITDKNTTRTLYVVNLESKQNIRMGRGHDSDVRVTDISVSRFHALIRKEKNGSFYLEDNNSKFGSLVLMQVPKMRVIRNFSLPVQIGRTMLTFDIKKPFNIFSCFCSAVVKNEKAVDYQMLNSKNINFENCNFIKIQAESNDDQEDDDMDILSSLKAASIKLAIPENVQLDNPNELQIPILNQLLKESLISQKNTFSFKVIEAEEPNPHEIGLEEILKHQAELESPKENEAIVKGPGEYRVNRNRVYLERANTNFEIGKPDFQSIKQKFKKDLDSLRNVF